MKQKISRVLLVCLDIAAINFSFILAYLIRFEFDVDSDMFNTYIQVYIANWAAVTIIKLVIYLICGLYNSLWKYAGTDEIFRIVMAAGIGTCVTIGYFTMTVQSVPRGVYIITLLLDLVITSGIRLSYRYVRDVSKPGSFAVPFTSKGRRILSERTNVMIIGAGDAGATLIKEINNNRTDTNKRVVVAVDDDASKLHSRIAGVKVAGNRYDIPDIIKKYNVNEIMISVPSAKKQETRDIVAECNKTGCKTKILPSFADLINENVSVSKLRDVDIEDLLGRDSVDVQLSGIKEYISGKIVLVTGAGGSIGSELCDQIASYKPRKLIALDIYENTLFELGNEIKRKYPNLDFDSVIGSIRSLSRLKEIFDEYRPHVVFHAAAHKHVPLMEGNPKEAIINNILGTKNVVDVSDEFAVEKCVLISTDKAVNPTSVMGATKRAAEMIVMDKSEFSRTKYTAVRFGNVLGSNGSVIPLFRKQIAAGGPVTVTHREVTRFFMTISEAVQLVIQAGAMAEGGEIFILDMGESVKIYDLAENVIRLSGYTPGTDIEIKITGLRPGEKLYEELLLDEEGIQNTDHSKIFMGHQISPSDAMEELLDHISKDGIDQVKREIEEMTPKQAKEWLRNIVPNYQNGSSGE